MAHEDICPCKHGTKVCLLPCQQCQPGVFTPDDVQDRIREEYHRLSAEQEKVNAVVRAWVDAGPVPDFHREWQHRLRREWPTLAKALDLLAGGRL